MAARVMTGRATIEQLRAAYETGGLEAAVTLDASMGAPSRSATKQRLIYAGVHTPKPREPDWTTSEIATLRRCWAAGMSARQIAELVPHTEKAIILRRAMIGLPARTRARWTSGQRRILERAADAILADLARKLGRSESAIGSVLVDVLCRRHRRMKAERVVDLGGMATTQNHRAAFAAKREVA